MRRAVYRAVLTRLRSAIWTSSEDPPLWWMELVVGVLNNSSKTPLFSVEERVNILLEATKDIPNVRVESFSGLSVDFAKNCGARFIVRGLRAITVLIMSFSWPRPTVS